MHLGRQSNGALLSLPSVLYKVASRYRRFVKVASPYRRSWRRVLQVKDLEILSVDSYSLPLRIFAPHLERPLPVIVWYHGGGFIMGGLNSHTCAIPGPAVGCSKH